jgi:hypothetical protein
MIADETTVIYRSPAFRAPDPGCDCVRVTVAEVFPYPSGVEANDARRRTVDFIRGWLHPDTLRRPPSGWVADVWDGHFYAAHREEMFEAPSPSVSRPHDFLGGKSWFVAYLERVRERLGPLPDDDAD